MPTLCNINIMVPEGGLICSAKPIFTSCNLLNYLSIANFIKVNPRLCRGDTPEFDNSGKIEEPPICEPLKVYRRGGKAWKMNRV